MFRRLRKKASKGKLKAEVGVQKEEGNVVPVKGFDHILADLATCSINGLDSQKQQQEILVNLQFFGSNKQSSKGLQRQRSNTDDTESSSLKSLPFCDSDSQHVQHHNPASRSTATTTRSSSSSGEDREKNSISSSRNLQIISSMDEDDEKIVIYYAQSPSPSNRSSRQFTFSSNDDDDCGNDCGAFVGNNDDYGCHDKQRKDENRTHLLQSSPSLLQPQQLLSSRRRRQRSSSNLAMMRQFYLGHDQNSIMNENERLVENSPEPEPLYSL